MWCRLCGAPLSALAAVCSACGRPTDLQRSPAHAEATGPGEPCASGRGMGGFQVAETDLREDVAGITLAGLPTTGEQTLFEVRGPGGVRLRLAYVEWRGGEREIRWDRRQEAPLLNEHLLGRPRIEIEAWGDGFLSMDLGQLQVDEAGDDRVHPVSEYELDMAARTCIRCALQAAGATAMGTRQEVLGVCDDRRHLLCTTFPRAARLVPSVVFTLTRVAPVIHRDLRERA